MEAAKSKSPEQKAKEAIAFISIAKKVSDVNMNVLLGDIIAANDRELLMQVVDVLSKKEEETREHWMDPQAKKVIAERLDLPI